MKVAQDPVYLLKTSPQPARKKSKRALARIFSLLSRSKKSTAAVANEPTTPSSSPTYKQQSCQTEQIYNTEAEHKGIQTSSMAEASLPPAPFSASVPTIHLDSFIKKIEKPRPSKRRRPSCAFPKERDIFSFFDTGSVTQDCLIQNQKIPNYRKPDRQNFQRSIINTRRLDFPHSPTLQHMKREKPKEFKYSATEDKWEAMDRNQIFSNDFDADYDEEECLQPRVKHYLSDIKLSPKYQRKKQQNHHHHHHHQQQQQQQLQQIEEILQTESNRKPNIQPAKNDEVAYEEGEEEVQDENYEETAAAAAPVDWYCEKVTDNDHYVCQAETGTRIYAKSPELNPHVLARKSSGKSSRSSKSKDSVKSMPASQSSISKLKRRISRQLSTMDRKKVAVIVGITLATAGLAALIIYLLKYKKTGFAGFRGDVIGGDDEDVECDDELWTPCDDQEEEMGIFDDFGSAGDPTCSYEKYNRVKCMNPDYRALISECEKLEEDNSVVCMSQDFKKITKRHKDRRKCDLLEDSSQPICESSDA